MKGNCDESFEEFDHRGWINYLAVNPEFRRMGIGMMMMKEAEKLLSLTGCPKINLQVRTDNLDVIRFYEAIGYRRDDVVCLGKRLKSDEFPK
ncbi:GNAT family N-acetyltransferase [bacterium]|nr:GNAT family N-acetyltransferase [FCB group bacterium]MBL7191079.1 GNAT family N-acetyltransferase [bacterium]